MSIDEAMVVAGYVGRMPTPLELHLFDTMWSEHCSYKSSKKLLSILPAEGPAVVLGPGEDSGIVRFAVHGGVEWDVVVAHESHNHPSQVLPVEGAATGVGGIVRDVYCMGAKVIGTMDLLRFGDPCGLRGASVRAVARGVVQGIWQYGNALGVPNLGGDTVFHPGFDENCLVNVVAVGLVRHDRIVRSRVPEAAQKQPYVLVLAGKPTDATGFGGATFASADLEEEGRTGAVQVADPFLKRVLSEANAAVVEMLFERGVEFGFKDLGAGGIACVSSELAAHGGMGMDLWLDAVPVAVRGLPPEVIACSETQERFGLAVPEETAPDVLRVYNEDFDLPGLHPGAGAAVIGRFTAGGSYRVTCGGAEVACTPVEAVTRGISYDRPVEECPPPPPGPASMKTDPSIDIPAMALSVQGASRKPVFSFYDSEVQGSTRLRPGEADASVVAPLPGCRAGLAVAGDGNPWISSLDPWLGGAHAVGEAVRNVVAVGATPIAATDCLNYGSPEVPEVMWQFRRGVEGIAHACRALGFEGDALPIVSGNVSFYNMSPSGRAIPPSPVVAVLGRLDDFTRSADCTLRGEGNAVVLFGERLDELGGSLFSRVCLSCCGGTPPGFRGALEKSMALHVLDWISRGIVRSCHDISEGGVAIAALEMVMASIAGGPLGIALDIGPDPVALYSETPGYLLEVEADRLPAELPPFARVLGRVTGRPLLEGEGWSVDAGSLSSRWRDLLASVVWREEL